MRDLVFKKVKKEDKEQLFQLIDIVLSELEDPEWFIPYEQWELDSMFDEENYASLYGAYDKDKLIRKCTVVRFTRYAFRF